MATKKKPAAKKPAAKKAAPARAAAKPAVRRAGNPSLVSSFVKYAEKNPAMALTGIIVVALGLMFIFG